MALMKNYLEYYVDKIKRNRDAKSLFLIFSLVLTSVPVWGLSQLLPAIKEMTGLAVYDTKTINLVTGVNISNQLPIIDAVTFSLLVSLCLSFSSSLISNLSFRSYFLASVAFFTTVIILGLLFGSN